MNKNLKLGKELSLTMIQEIQKGALAIDHLPDWALKAKKSFGEEDLVPMITFITNTVVEEVSNNTSWTNQT